MISKEKVIELNKAGKTCQEIRDLIGGSLTTIRKYIKEAGLVTNSKITRLDNNILEKVQELRSKGKTNTEIAKELHMSPMTSRKYTKILGEDTNSIKTKSIDKKPLELTQEQEEVLYGSLLGDMCLSTTSNLYRVHINHGGEQEAYFDHKCKIFNNILGKVDKSPRYDKRTQKYYNRYAVRLLAHPKFKELYDLMYVNGVKTVTKEWLDHITPRGLAFWFMDDGTNSGVLATNSFSLNECILIKDWFKEKWDIDCTIQTQKSKKNFQYTIYIRTKSRERFYDLVIPYFIPSMLYKLNNWNPKSRELRETP